MLKELNDLKLYRLGVDVAQGFLAGSMQSYEERLDLVRAEMHAIQKEMATDLLVQQDTDALAAVQLMFEEAQEKAKQAIIDYWEEFGFSTGKKSVVMEGCQLRIRETTSRQIIDPGVVVQAAIDDGVGDKVVRELRPIFNKAAFNSWVDLKSPPGVEVTHAVTASVTILEKE